MTKKTILVTGGAGYIGSHTIIELLNNDFNVISIDCFFNSSPEVYSKIQDITGKTFKSYDIDLCNINDLEKIVSENKIDGVIHFAAFKSVGESVEKPLKYYHNNINSLINLLSFDLNNIIFSSSCSVYSNVEKLPVTEDTPIIKAESPYAHTKQISEEILESFCKQHVEFKAVSLRYFNPVGAHNSGKIGEDPINKPNNLFPLITGTAIGKYPKLTILGGDYPTHDGTCIRDYVHVSDIANAHILALNYLLENRNNINYDVFNLGTGNGISVLEAIKSFENVSGLKLNYEISDRRKGDIISIYSDNTKVEKILGWKPLHYIDSMMMSAWQWEINCNKKARI